MFKLPHLFSTVLTAAILIATADVSPAAAATSPSGTTIPSATQIIDSNGTVWTIGNGQYPGESFENGVFDYGWNIKLLLYYNGVIYAQVFDESWYTHASGSWSYLGATDPRPAASLYMRYSLYSQSVPWVTCGSANGSSGCFGSGQLGPFGHVCAVTGSNGNVYVADTAGPSESVEIWAYQQTVGVTSSNAVTQHFYLPISANATATCSMAATGNYLYFGTNTSKVFSVQLQSPYKIAPAPTYGFGPATSITSNGSNVIVNQADSSGTPNTLFSVIDANNNSLGDGGESVKSFVVEGNTVTP